VLLEDFERPTSRPAVSRSGDPDVAVDDLRALGDADVTDGELVAARHDVHVPVVPIENEQVTSRYPESSDVSKR